MARIAMKLTAHGTEPPCDGCGRSHVRGDQMTAYEYDNGDPAGWHCPSCTRFYERVGRFDPAAALAPQRKEGE